MAAGAVALSLVACGTAEEVTPTPVAPTLAPAASAAEAEPRVTASAPGSSPTATATPLLAPASAPTPRSDAPPKPAPVRAADFDAARFAREIAGVPPDAIRLSFTATAPDDVGTFSVVLSSVTADELIHLRLEFSTAEQRVLLEFIGAGDRVYLRGETGEETIEWLKATTVAGERSPLDAVPGADVFDLATLQRAWTAEAVAPCRDGVTCFVLRNDESVRDRLFVDADSYRPVLFTTDSADGAPQEVSIDWNADVVIEVPSNAVDVSSDELGFAFLALLLSVAQQAEANAPPNATPAADATPRPTAAAEPTVTPVAEASEEGRGRDRPFAFGQALAAADWQIEALDVIRGDAAWDLLEDASRFNDPAPAGNEYVLVNLAAMYTGDDEADISGFSFRITGSSGRADRTASLATPDPELRAKLRTGGRTMGWVAFTVRADETDLILIFDPGFSFDDETRRYLALEPGASVIPEWAALPAATGLGAGRADPAPPGDTVANRGWEVRVLETIRGDAAQQLLGDANPFTDPPPEGFEYVAVRILARNVSRVDALTEVGGASFRLTGNDAVLYASPPIGDPSPRLDFELFPGGSAEGWLAFQSSLADSGLMLRFAHFSFSDDDVRYLALDPEAGVPPLPGPLAQPTDVGREPETAVLLGGTATTDAFEIEVIEVVRGEDALRMAAEASQFNDPPDAGMEYVQVRVRARNTSNSEQVQSIDVTSFQTLGDRANVWAPPFVTQPAPAFSADLFPGGVAEGWITLQAGEGETGLRVLYESLFDFAGSSRRYFAIE